MYKIRLYKLNALPVSPEPNAVYFIKSGSTVNLYVTDQLGSPTQVDFGAINWTAITGKPTATPSQIDQAVLVDAHAHLNKPVLDKFSDSGGSLFWDGSAVGGGIGDANYIHNQAIPSNVWTISHPLNKYPVITTVDSAGTVVKGSERYISLGVVEVSFSAAFSGKAYLN